MLDGSYPAQPWRVASVLQFTLWKQEALYYISSEHKRCWSGCAYYGQAALHLCYLGMEKTGFLQTRFIGSQ